MTVRIGFNTRLGHARVAELVALTYDADPTGNDEIMRAIANRCEILWARVMLMDTLPAVFMDAGAALQSYNDEGAFRSIDVEVRERDRARSLVQIEEWLAILAGDIEIGNGPLVQIWTSESPCPRPEPGDTAFRPDLDSPFFNQEHLDDLPE